MERVLPNRKKNRLPNFDYSSRRIYFVTICTRRMFCLFGNINNGAMEKNIAGDMVVEQWECLRRRYRMLKLHDFVVMPNHFHGIVEIVGEPLVGSREMVKHFDQVNRRKGQLQEIVPTLSSIVGSFKSITTNEYIKLVKSKNIPRFDRSLWQRSFHDHVIRSEESLLKIQEYIANNPLKWELDYYFQKT